MSMTYSKILSMVAAVAVTTGGLIAIIPTASAKERPVVVLGPVDEVPTRRVSFVDLNLATPAGEKSLYRRVANAVRSVCYEATGPMAGFYETNACRGYAWDGARPQMKRAMLRAQELAAGGSTAVSIQAIVLAAPR